MPSTRYETLAAAALVEGAEVLLVGQLDSNVQGITSTQSEKKRVTGIVGTTNATGILIVKLAGTVLSVLDFACLSLVTRIIPLNIDVPVGQTCSFYAKSASGTDPINAVVQYEIA